MLLLLKFPILFAAFWFWRESGNEKGAASIWAIGAFVSTVLVFGFSGPIGIYGIGAFFLGWLLFWGLSYAEGTLFFYPASFFAFLILIGSSVFFGF